MAILVPESYAAMRAILIWVAHAATQVRGVIHARNAAQGLVWVSVTAVPIVCDEIHDQCYHRAHMIHTY